MPARRHAEQLFRCERVCCFVARSMKSFFVNFPLTRKGWATQLLSKVAVLRMHFSLGPRKIKVSCAFLIFALATAAHAQWTPVSSETERSPVRGLEHRYLVFENTATGERVSAELAIFSTKSCRLRIIDQPSEERVDLSEMMEREKCLAGVNGGYFDPDYNPIGLVVADGKTIAPLRKARLLSGVLLSSGGKIQILRVAEFSSQQKIDAAIECGPMVVDLAKPVHGLEATRPARRTFAAVAVDGRGAIGFCSDATLSDLASILATPFASDFKIQRALNLDGGSSSAFWFKRANGSAFSIAEEKTVRDFVTIVPR
jgi:uncharacterized protein YigE (DUF2233 family)